MTKLLEMDNERFFLLSGQAFWILCFQLGLFNFLHAHFKRYPQGEGGYPYGRMIWDLFFGAFIFLIPFPSLLILTEQEGFYDIMTKTNIRDHWFFDFYTNFFATRFILDFLIGTFMPITFIVHHIVSLLLVVMVWSLKGSYGAITLMCGFTEFGSFWSNLQEHASVLLGEKHLRKCKLAGAIGLPLCDVISSLSFILGVMVPGNESTSLVVGLALIFGCLYAGRNVVAYQAYQKYLREEADGSGAGSDAGALAPLRRKKRKKSNLKKEK